MKRDIDRLQALYEQILISEDAEISKYGYSKEFISALYSRFNIPHTATFVKLTKMPYTSEMDDKYRLVIAKIKNPEDHKATTVAVMGSTIYEFNGKDFNRFTSFDFSTIRSAVDKTTIYGALGNEDLHYTDSWEYERERKRKEKLKPIYVGIFDLLQSKFGSIFHKRIEDLSEYIYSNIRKFKLTPRDRDGNNSAYIRRQTDIEQVINTLIELDKIKNQSKQSLVNGNNEYGRICDEVIKKFLIKYGIDFSSASLGSGTTHIELFVKQFNKYPSYSNLGKVFLKALDAFENDVISFIHEDEVNELI
jgi:hypothetical protein